MRKYVVASVLALLLFASCGGEEDQCYRCVANTTEAVLCTDNYQAAAANDNLEVDSLDEYIDELRRNGFECTLTE